MSSAHHHIQGTSRGPARWFAHAAGESGDTMIEVMVAALLVALIAAGVLTGFSQVSSLSGQERQRAQATALAQEDQARLRGLPITQLAGTAGNQTAPPVLIDGTSYKVTSKSSYISGAGTPTCTAGQTGTTADELEISSSVWWSNIGNRPLVVVHSIATPGVGGALVVSATTPINTGSTGSTGTVGLAGLTATVAGIGSLATDSTGCAIFGGLTAGTYALTLVPPTGYVDVNGNTTIAAQAPVVTATQTNYYNAPTLAQPGGIDATFSSTYTGATGASGSTGATGATTVTGPSDQFSIFEGNALTPAVRVLGSVSTPTTNNFQNSVNSGLTIYPTETPLSGNYSVEAGSCGETSATPPLPAVESASVTSGQTTNVALPEPGMIVLPYTTTVNTTNWTFDDTQAAQSNPTYSIVYSTTPTPTWVTNTNTGKDFGNKEHDDATAGNTATFTFTGTSVTWIGTTARGNGTANVTLDNVAQGTFDEGQASNTPVYLVPIHTWSGLTQGQHTLVITVNGAHVKGNANNVSIDEFTGSSTTTSSPTFMTTKPNIVVWDADTSCTNAPDYPPTQIPSPTTGALQFPGLPWATNYTVCVDNANKVSPLSGTATNVANTSYTTGNPVVNGIVGLTINLNTAALCQPSLNY